MYDVEHAGTKHGVVRFLSTAIAVPGSGSSSSAIMGAVTLGYGNAVLIDMR
jgi:hypothetical protein